MSRSSQRSPNTSRPSRFKFLVGRNHKAPPTRTGSVRRNQSIRRATSTRKPVQGDLKRRSGLASQPVLRPAGHLNWTEVIDNSADDKLDPSFVNDNHLVLSYRPSPMPQPTTKDSDLPPLPAEATSSTSEPQKTGLLKRFATKFRSPSTHHAPANSTSDDPSPKNKRKTTLRLPSMPKSTPPLTNSFTSPELRQAALRERGLLPSVPHPYKDSHGYMVPLSEQEKYLDNRFTVVPEDGPRSSGDEDEETEAKRIREAWMKKNQEDEKSASSTPPEPVKDNSASERACALAVSSDNLVIGKQQSPQLGTFVQAHSPKPITPITVDLHEALTPIEGLGAREPQDIPLPPSPILPISQIPAEVETDKEAHNNDDDKVGDGEKVVIESEMKVAKWLESTPTGSPHSAKSFGRAQEETASAENPLPAIKEEASSPSSTAPSTIRGRKEKPSPISITAIAVKASSQSAPPTSVPSPPQSPPVEFEDPRSPRQSTLPIVSVSPPPPTVRGRSKTVGEPEICTSLSLAPSTSTDTTTSGDSRSRSKVPALSPTRTASSSAASDVPITPTTLSRPRNYSASTGSSEGPHLRNGKRAVTLPGLSAGLRIQTNELDEGVEQRGGVDIAKVIVESPVDDHHSVPEEFKRMDGGGDEAEKKDVESEGEAPDELPTPRPTRSGVGTKERRKSITLTSFFAPKSHSMGALASETPPQPQPYPKLGLASRSMSNLRRSVAGTISSRFGLRKQKSTLVIDTGRANTVGSPLPASPVKLPSSPLSPRSPTPVSPSLLGPRGGSRSQTPVPPARLRPMPLSPTMHSRGSILMEMHGIEDDESRRLSELAFLG